MSTWTVTPTAEGVTIAIPGKLSREAARALAVQLVAAAERSQELDRLERMRRRGIDPESVTKIGAETK